MGQYSDIYLTCKVQDNTVRTSKNKGTPSVCLKLGYTDPATRQPGVVYADLWLSEKCVDKTLENLYKVFGWSGKISDLNEPILAGHPCIAVCEEEEYEGKTRLKVKFINKPGKPLERAEKSLIADLDSKYASVTANLQAQARTEGVKFAGPKEDPAEAEDTPAPAGEDRFKDVPPPVEDDLPF